MDGFERRKEMKKTDILEAALTLFMQYGIQKVSIAEIAKKANVSQVTIYNYFESKHNLTQEVLKYFINKSWKETEKIFDSDVPFPDKVKGLIFNKKEAASQISSDFYHYFMKEYTDGSNYIEEFFAKKAVPRMMELFDEGKEKGYVDPSISNEAILFYIQMIRDSMQKEEIYQRILPFTEDITKLIFYGIVGK